VRFISHLFSSFHLGFLLTLLALATVLPAVTAGPLKPLASNPRYFTDGSGKAIFLTGSHTWANFATDQGNTEFDYDGYLDFLVAHNLNFFRGWMWDLPHSNQAFNGGPFDWKPLPWLRTGPGLATDGKPKFDLSQFDQSYFDRVRTRVIQARDRGIYVAIMLFQGYAWQFDRTVTDGFPLDGRNNINGIDAGPADAAATLQFGDVTRVQEAYVSKVIDTLIDLDNVLYEIANEAAPHSTLWQYHMIDYIHRYERTKSAQHPVGMTFQYKGGTQEDLYASPADWISPDCTEEFRENPPPADGSKVIVMDTDHGYGWKILKADGPAKHQAWAWRNFCRGNHTLFMDPYLARPTGNTAPRNQPLGVNPREPYFGLRPDPYWEPLRTTLGQTRAYALKINLAEMAPRGELSSTGYCLAHPDREYLIYHPGPDRGFTVNFGPGTYTFEWFNPSTGLLVNSGELNIVVQGQQNFAAPFSGPAVLHLKRAN